MRFLPGGEQAEGGQVVPGLPGVLLRAAHLAAQGGWNAAATQACGRGGVSVGAAVRTASPGSGALGGRPRGRGGG